MKAKEKADREWEQRLTLYGLGMQDYEEVTIIYEICRGIAIKEAKKEVFDGIEKLRFQVLDGSLSGDLKYTHGYIDLKKRHLQ